MSTGIINDSILCKLSDVKVLGYSLKEWLSGKAQDQELLLNAITAALQCDRNEEVDEIINEMQGKNFSGVINGQYISLPISTLIRDVFNIAGQVSSSDEVIEEVKIPGTNASITDLVSYLDTQTVSLQSEVSAIEVMLDDSIDSTADKITAFRDKMNSYGAGYNNSVTETFSNLISNGGDLLSVLSIATEGFSSLCENSDTLEDIISAYSSSKNDFSSDNPVFSLPGIDINWDSLFTQDYLYKSATRWQSLRSNVEKWWRNRTVFNKNLPDFTQGAGQDPYLDNVIEYSSNITKVFNSLPESGASGLRRIIADGEIGHWLKVSNVFGTLFIKANEITAVNEEAGIWNVNYDYAFLPSVSRVVTDIDLDGEYLLNGPTSHSVFNSLIQDLKVNNDFSSIKDVLVESTIIKRLISNRYAFISSMLVEYYRTVTSRESVYAPIWTDNPYKADIFGETEVPISNEGVYCIATNSRPAASSQMTEEELEVVNKVLTMFAEKPQFSIEYVAMAALNLIGLTKVSGTGEKVAPYFFPYTTDLTIPQGAIHLATDDELEKRVQTSSLIFTSVIALSTIAVVAGPKLLKWRRDVNRRRATEYATFQSRMWNGEILDNNDWRYYKWLSKKASSLATVASFCPSFSKRNGDSDLLNRVVNDVTTIKRLLKD